MKLRIKESRKAAGMKQRELAKALGVSVAYISKIERGETPINLQNLEKISKALNEPIQNLVEFDHFDHYAGPSDER